MNCPCCKGEMSPYDPDAYFVAPDVCPTCIELHGNDIWPHAHGEGWRRYCPDDEPRTGPDSDYRWFDYNGGVYTGVNPFRRCQTRVPPSGGKASGGRVTHDEGRRRHADLVAKQIMESSPDAQRILTAVASAIQSGDMTRASIALAELDGREDIKDVVISAIMPQRRCLAANEHGQSCGEDAGHHGPHRCIVVWFDEVANG